MLTPMNGCRPLNPESAPYDKLHMNLMQEVENGSLFT